MNDLLYTRKQLGNMYGISQNLTTKILQNIHPEGASGRWPAYKEETFLKAKNDYYSSLKLQADHESEISNDGLLTEDSPLERKVLEADLRCKLAKAESLETDNLERRNNLVSRKDVEDLFRFIVKTYAETLRETTKAQDDYYNMLCESLTKEIHSYIRGEKISNIISEEVEEEAQKSTVLKGQIEFDFGSGI